MALDRHARRFLDLANLGAAGRSPTPTVADMRRGMAELAGFAPARPADVASRDASIMGPQGAIPLRVYSPAARVGRVAPGLIFFHGGGWLSGNLDTHDSLCAILASEADIRVLAVDYRLAPEHRFPQGLLDCQAAVAAIFAQAESFGVDPLRLGVAGDSSGGNLAVAALQAARATGPRLALQLLLCPVMDALGRTASRQAMATGHLLDETTMQRYWENYRIDGLDPADPRVSPLRAADFSGLPPALIHTAEFDPVRDEGELYAQALQRAGVAVRLRRHDGLIHNFYGLGGAIPAADAALREIAREVRAALHGQAPP